MNLDCLKLTCYFGERHRTESGFVADQLLDVFGRGELATSIMMRGIEGFGLKHRLRSDTSLTLSEDLPAVAIAVDVRPRIEAVVDEVAAIPSIGLVTIEQFFGRNADVPMMILAVGSGDRIAAVLPELDGMLPQPLLTLERLRIIKRDGVMVNRPQHIPRTDEQGRALFQKIMIFTSEDAIYAARARSAGGDRGGLGLADHRW